jgi:hypothetical protein
MAVCRRSNDDLFALIRLLPKSKAPRTLGRSIVALDPSHQGWALSGVAGLALDSKAASTSAIVVQASSTDAIR